MTGRPCCLLAAAALAVPALATPPKPSNALDMRVVGRYETRVFSNNGAEIPAYDPATRRLYVTSQAMGRVEVLDLTNPAAPKPLPPLDIAPHGDGPTSVAVSRGLVAVAAPAPDRVSPGVVVFFDAQGAFLAKLKVGALPDMLTFTPDGKRLLVANEGEALDYCTPGLQNDPEGSISVIDVSAGAAGLGPQAVRTADFRAFAREKLDPAVRIYGPHATVAQDLEPESIAVAPDSRTAFVSLQENDAVAVLDVEAARITAILGLGAKDHSLPGNGLDPSDQDGGIHIASLPVRGLYEPDGIQALVHDGQLYFLTANEGDARDTKCYQERARVAELKLDPKAFPDPAAVAPLKRLNVSRASGARGGRYEALYSLGGRSFSIWSAAGERVFDSGAQFEELLAAQFPAGFNSDDDRRGSFDSRSDDSGPEPEGLVLGSVGDRAYAFVGLERMGGVMVYDVTDPRSPSFVRYATARDFAGDPQAGTAGDLAPEGLAFVPAAEAPGGEALLIVANEVSGTVTLWALRPAAR